IPLICIGTNYYEPDYGINAEARRKRGGTQRKQVRKNVFSAFLCGPLRLSVEDLSPCDRYTSSGPVLSPILSIFTPAFSRIVSSKFDIGVSSVLATWRPVSNCPPSLPAIRHGRLLCRCRLPSPMPPP